jgi:glycosyltransferase involved in cell wall biosynthesis
MATRAVAAPVKILSVVIPVYNEERTIGELVGLVVKAKLPPGVGREIIVVNDCSRDGTAAQIDALPAFYPGVDFQIRH